MSGTEASRERSAGGMPLPRNANILMHLSPSPPAAGATPPSAPSAKASEVPKINLFEEDPHPHETNEIWIMGQGPVPALYVILRRGVTARYRFVGFQPDDDKRDDFEIVPAPEGTTLASTGGPRRLDIEEEAGDADQTGLVIEVHARANSSMFLKIIGTQPSPPINYKPKGYESHGPEGRTV